VLLVAGPMTGLRCGVRATGLGPGDRVLVPARRSARVETALGRAGLALVAYDSNELLRRGPRHLDEVAPRNLAAVYLVHEIGFPADAQACLDWCSARGVLLIEDATSAWPAERDGVPVGALGEVAIWGLASVGLPGLALLRAPGLVPCASAVAGRAAVLRGHARWLAARSDLASLANARLAPAGDGQTRAFGVPSDIARLLRRLGEESVGIRQAHYHAMLDELAGEVAPGFEALPEGAAPFAFPVRDGDGLRRRLEAGRIRAICPWQPSAPGQAVIGVPVHQELGTADVQRIITAVGGRRRLSAPPLEEVDHLDSLRSEWTQLAEQSRNIFMTWEWARAWLTHLGGAQKPILRLAWSPSGEPLAMVPLSLSGGALRIVRFVGHGPADHLGPICAPGDSLPAAEAVATTLESLVGSWDVFLAENLPGAGWRGRLGGTLIRREASPVMAFEGRSWDDFLRSRSANFRQQVRRRERRLRDRYDVQFRLTEDPDQLPGDLDTLMELHEARWAGGSSDAFSGARREFHHAFAAEALELGWLRLWTMTLDNRPVAAWYGFRFGDAEWFYQSGRQPAFDAESVGFVLLCHTMREAADDGVPLYRLLRGDEAYKGRFATDATGLESVISSGSARGRLALAGALAAAASPSRGRRLAGRLIQSKP
jgi:CelD/BcsL family acetyltransferase involved in cellulose biosynthesis